MRKNKKQIRESYNAMLDMVAKGGYDGRGKVDVYICKNGHRFYTEYIDKGVTPFCMICRHCSDEQQPMTATHTPYQSTRPHGSALMYTSGFVLRSNRRASSLQTSSNTFWTAVCFSWRTSLSIAAYTVRTTSSLKRSKTSGMPSATTRASCFTPKGIITIDYEPRHRALLWLGREAYAVWWNGDNTVPTASPVPTLQGVQRPTETSSSVDASASGVYRQQPQRFQRNTERSLIWKEE